MNLCLVTKDSGIALMESDEAPTQLEVAEYFRMDGQPFPSRRTVILERLTHSADPVNGIFMYEEVER